jgi:phosphatidylserine decarboxylase
VSGASRPGRSPDLPRYLRLLPRHALSRGLGALGRLPLPRPLRAPLLGTYAWAFGVRLDEAARPLAGYPTFLEFFARGLRPGARPLPADPCAVLSPADGHAHAAGAVVRGQVLQAKGQWLDLPTLLDGDADAFEGGSYLVVHLRPGDYHRFHWPFDACARTLRHIPGDLWPVHGGAASRAPVLAWNERAVLRGEVVGGGDFALVAIGALNVGSIRLAFHPLRTNRGAPARPRAWALEGVRGERGGELGWFEFGSALVLLLAPGAGLIEVSAGTELRVGQSIGRLARRL